MTQLVVQLTTDELRQLIREELGKLRLSQPSRYRSTQEIARMLGVAQGTVQKWHRREGLPAIAVGRVLRFDIDAVRSWCEQRMTAPGSWTARHSSRCLALAAELSDEEV